MGYSRDRGRCNRLLSFGIKKYLLFLGNGYLVLIVYFFISMVLSNVIKTKHLDISSAYKKALEEIQKQKEKTNNMEAEKEQIREKYILASKSLVTDVLKAHEW